MPGGALTANTQMLRDNNLMDKYPLFIGAMGEVVKKGGFGTSVTPVSQFYFQQAFNNVMFGPWKKIAEGYGNMVLGYLGKTPVAPDPEIVKIASEQMGKPPITDHLSALEADPKKGLKAAKARLQEEGLPVTDENLFIVASCEDKGILFLKGKSTIGVRKNQPPEVAKAAAKAGKSAGLPGAYDVSVNGQSYNVRFEGANAIVNGTSYQISVKEATAAAIASTAPAIPASGAGEDILSQLPGLVLRIEKPAGSAVKKGDTILVVESMKMETPVVAPKDGTVAAILVNQGDQVASEQPLARIC